ncbi:MAG: beta-lactamase family protein [Pseudomonadota bacterium]|nr:beta-lactamase family protein [Pseudomonadota bacterium]
MILSPAFEPLKRQFNAHFEDGKELGARFTVVKDGEVVFDAWNGFADRARTSPFSDRTLTPVFSTTKAVAAIMVARLVDAGRLAYDQPVAEVWPEFAQGGKAAVTVEQALSHQAGLPGFLEKMDPADWFDWDLICAKLAAMKPMWKVGAHSGYHAVTYGYLAGEIFRRVDGRTMGRALAEDIAGPLGLDLFIGLPDPEFPRVAELEKPHSTPNFGRITDATRAAFLTPWAAPGGRGGDVWRRAEIPSANGHTTANSMARLMGALATDGTLDGRTILSPEGIKGLTRQRIRGEDLVLPFDLSWGAGVMRNSAFAPYGPNPDSFGHSGWGGSCAFADPGHGVAMAYVMNKQSAQLIGDDRAVALIKAAYACLS